MSRNLQIAEKCNLSAGSSLRQTHIEEVKIDKAKIEIHHHHHHYHHHQHYYLPSDIHPKNKEYPPIASENKNALTHNEIKKDIIPKLSDSTATFLTQNRMGKSEKSIKPLRPLYNEEDSFDWDRKKFSDINNIRRKIKKLNIFNEREGQSLRSPPPDHHKPRVEECCTNEL